MKKIIFEKITNLILKKFGYKVEMISAKERRNRLIDHIIISDTNVVFDIGANTGQFAQLLRTQGYKGKIISFEPVTESFKELKKNSIEDRNWIVLKYAVGSENTSKEINISENSWSSSFLPLEDGIVEIEPTTRYIKRETVNVVKLDSVFDFYANNNDQVFLKIDVQGHEREVLEGCENSLPKISGLMLEASLSPHYKGEWLFQDAIKYLTIRNYSLIDLIEGMKNKSTGALIQLDAFFWKFEGAYNKKFRH